MRMPSPRSSRGFTLVELLAAMTIGLLILGAASSFAINTWRTQSRGQAGKTPRGARATWAPRCSGMSAKWVCWWTVGRLSAR
jgi:prepilin-type N-terminal cleavage/methylation domain-containing protein